jgi:Ca2+-binding RTX toxin-like protein
MNAERTSGGGSQRFTAIVPLFLLSVIVAFFFLMPAAEADAASCLGERVTLSSNAKKIEGRKGHDVIQGGPGRNRIDGNGGNDRICGGGGDDFIIGGRGNDRADGEAGSDSVHGDRGSDPMLSGGKGSDRVAGGTGNDDVRGGPGDRDFVHEGFGDGRADGGPGDRDVVFGDIGVDRIDGGPGRSDIASYSSISQSLFVNLAGGSVSGAERERLIDIEDAIGGSGNDLIRGSGEPNRLDGGPGDDVLVASGRGDRAYGGAGTNRCDGYFASKNSCGQASGQDGTAVSLFESIDGTGSLVIDGNSYSDDFVLNFSRGSYTVRSTGGNKIRLGNRDSDSCRDSGAAVVCRGSVTKVSVSLGAGRDSVRIGNLPRRVGATIEGGPGSDDLQGGPNDDVIASGDDRSPDRLSGGGGDDALFGVNIEHPKRDSGAAVMVGGSGDDLLIGGQPCNGDLFNGGPGSNDSASFARVKNNGTRVKAWIGGPVLDPDLGRCNRGRITGSVEKIEGSKGPDILFGDSGSNDLLGMGGDDRLNGKGGFDKCSGGGGRDSLRNCEKGGSG